MHVDHILLDCKALHACMSMLLLFISTMGIISYKNLQSIGIEILCMVWKLDCKVLHACMPTIEKESGEILCQTIHKIPNPNDYKFLYDSKSIVEIKRSNIEKNILCDTIHVIPSLLDSKVYHGCKISAIVSLMHKESYVNVWELKGMREKEEELRKKYAMKKEKWVRSNLFGLTSKISWNFE